LYKNYQYDRKRFETHSAVLKKTGSTENLAAQITMDYHRLEKGMSLPTPRLGFAKDWISHRFINNLNRYIDDNTGADHLVLTSINVLVAYRDYHLSNGYQIPDVFAEIDELEKKFSSDDFKLGGCVDFTANELLDMNTRHSIRQFSDKLVDPNLVKASVKIAQRTPSVCNRQAWQVYVINTPNAITKVLELQNGNAGFGHQLNTVLAVTCDLTRMLTIGERNQAWIDGGMFCMSLLLALHSKGLGTCCLNLSLDCTLEIKFREALHIRPGDSPLMLIAVGHMREKVTVAQSNRRSLEDVITWVPELGIL